jgi:polar amino acid transport system substrate-binding protein
MNLSEPICLHPLVFYSMMFVSLFTSGFLLYRHKRLQEYSKLLRKVSITDRLTRVYNRLKIDTELENEYQRYLRNHEPFSIILLDIDHFKRVNDTYGHLVGDEVLKKISKLIQENSRSIDIIGRWGGEEFIIITPHTSRAGAIELAQKLREKIEKSKINPVGNITASFGVSQIEGNQSIEMLLHRVDNALYEAKENGRNRMVYL